MIQHGFTSTRDCDGVSLAVKEVVEEVVEEGVLSGPRLFIAGFALSQIYGHGDMCSSHNDQLCCGGSISGISWIVHGPAECYKFARDEL